MFDFSFGELLVVATVGLLVLGPKEFPVALRYVRGIIKSIRETSDTLKKQVDDMLELEDMRAAKRFIQGDDGKLYESFGLMEPLAKSSLPESVGTQSVDVPELSLDLFHKTHSSAETRPLENKASHVIDPSTR